MFDDCNTFFKGKPDGRVAASTPIAVAPRMGLVERPTAASDRGARPLPTEQYLHSRRAAVAFAV
jgi:hypothetical protein